MCRFPVAIMGVMAIGDRWAELISVPSARRDERAIAGQEHGILLINAGLQLVLVVQIQVRIVGADAPVAMPANAAIAEQHVLAPSRVVGAIALENPHVILVSGLIGNHGYGLCRPRLHRPWPAGGVKVSRVIGVVPAHQVAIPIGIGAAN